MEFAPRTLRINESATFKYSALAKKPGMIDLTIGRTNFDTPKIIKDAAKKALDEGKVNYTPTKGIPELREKIAEKLTKENKITGIDKEQVIVSAGAKQLIFEALMALISDNDVVAMPNPSWVSYEALIALAEGKPLWLPTKPEKGFIPDEDFFSALENSKTKLIMLNSPNNPTGAAYPKSVIQKIVDIAQRKDAWILSDEIYERLIYEGEHFSAGSIHDKTITINGYSKECSMTGWRLGYAASRSKEAIEKMNLIQGQTVSCATSFVQWAAIAAYTDEARKNVAEMKKELKDRRDHLMKGIKETGAVCTKPAGAFYIFPSYGDQDDIKLADKLLEGGVATIPGSPFGSQGRGCVRMSYGATKIAEIDQAIERIKNALK
jgi:aspartate aminotransferase